MILLAENERELVEKVWAKLAPRARGGLLVGLQGELGAGKTSLVKGIAALLGVKEPVTSPTFNLRKVYQIKLPVAEYLQHIDLYRLHPDKTNQQEVAEWLSDKKSLTFVEWPENLAGLAKKLDVLVTITVRDNQRRQVEIKWL